MLGIPETLLGGAYAAAASSDVAINSMTLVSTIGGNTRAGAGMILVAAVGGSLYINTGAAATASNCIDVIAEGAPRLYPAGMALHALEKDSGAKVAATWWQ